MEKKRKISFSKDNIAWGMTAFIVICACIVFYLLLTKMPSVGNAISEVADVLMPIILGFVMAYLLLPVYNWLYRSLHKHIAGRLSQKATRRITKLIATVVSLALLIIVVVGLILLALPQVIESIVSLFESLPSSVDRTTEAITNLLKDYPEIASYATSKLDEIETSVMSFFKAYLMPGINNLLGSITMGVINAVTFMFNFVIGLIVCVYLLNSKETFAAQAKKVIYSLFSIEHSNRIIEDSRKIHAIFSGFISGKIIDPLIIGMITYPVLSIMHMPYCMMVSVIIGVTNIIPFFGPIIGAIPSVLIVLTADPLKSLYLLIYIMIIQTIDGNILGPKILGDSTGLPSFWVLFSITLGGGIFGFIGMILGVPVFATIYMFVSMGIDDRLSKKEMETDTEKYISVKEIDPETGAFEKLPYYVELEAEEAGKETADREGEKDGCDSNRDGKHPERKGKAASRRNAHARRNRDDEKADSLAPDEQATDCDAETIEDTENGGEPRE